MKDYSLVKIPDGAGAGWLEAWKDGRCHATLFVKEDETDLEAINLAIEELEEDPVISWHFTSAKAYREALAGIKWMKTQRAGFMRLKSFHVERGNV